MAVSKLIYQDIDSISETDIPDGHPVSLFHKHWRSLSRNGGVPSRRDFSPIQVPALLPYLVVLECLETDDGLDLRTRLEGEYLVSLTGRNNMGQSLKKALGAEGYQSRLEEAQRIRRTGEVLFSHIRAVDHQGEKHRIIRGTFPFTLDGPQVGQIFAVLGADTLCLL